MNKAYINGLGAVTPQGTVERGVLLPGIFAYEEPFLQIQKPDYKKYVDAKSLRRMSKIVRMGVYAAFDAMNDAGIEQPDAILTGTGMGCQKDTEKFLNGMIDNNETFGNPTAFMQSTHNTVGARIALMLRNQNENFTYVHRTFSFESALIDSILMLADDKNNILLGGVDEITQESWQIKTHINHYKKETVNGLELLNDKQPGALAGEGAMFFMLSSERNEKSYAAVRDVKTFFRPEGINEIEEQIRSFLQRNNLSANDIDLVLAGYNGDPEFDTIYLNLENSLFEKTAVGWFKHLTGDYDTASAFALTLAAKIISGEQIPEVILKKGSVKNPKTVLIYNQFRNVNHSLILLTDG
jgi:3-oxoacyl-(acyl-carrier-protein) synthase